MKTKPAKMLSHLIPPATLANIGRVVFGAYWQSPFAKYLKVQDQTMRRWTNDGCPAAYAANMRTLLKERTAEMGTALTSLEAFGDEGPPAGDLTPL